MDDEACDRIEEVMRVSHKYRFLKIEGIFNGVSRSEFLALMLIDKTNGDKQDISKCIQAGDICKGLNCTPAAISKMLKSLESKGWIIREVNKDNRRNTNIILTKNCWNNRQVIHWLYILTLIKHKVKQIIIYFIHIHVFRMFDIQITR